MDTKSKKSTKFVILGIVVFVVAILLAVGPGLVMKYMRAKWEDVPNYKVSTLKMNISGIVCKSNDGILYLKGDNNLFYVLENVDGSINDKIGQKCSVIGSFKQAKNNETVDGNPVRLFIDVESVSFSGVKIDVKKDINKNVDNEQYLKEKYNKKIEFRVKINTILNKPVLFDVISGKVSSFARKTLDGKDYTAYVLTDEFNDRYALYKKGKNVKNLDGKDIVVLGREILPEKNIPLFVDETTFEIYEVYDTEYQKIF